MACSQEFVKYIAGQIKDAGAVTWKKMFGEYGLFVNGRIVAILCEDQLFLKVTEAGISLYPELKDNPWHEGASPTYRLVEEVDDRDWLSHLVTKTWEALYGGKSGQVKKGKDKAAMEKLDYKKAYKELYQPGKKPGIIEVPEMRFIQVEGRGNPNTSAEYQQSIEILYGLSFGIKMSKMTGECPPGYFEYVVPPLEGLWWSEETAFDGKNITDKDKLHWISMIRQPDFVDEEVFERAKQGLMKKKPDLQFENTRLVKWTEGLCCQMMHIGPYDAEAESLEKMEAYIAEQGYELDICGDRRHHEIYLGDPRRTKPERLRTVLRHPVKRKE